MPQCSKKNYSRPILNNPTILLSQLWCNTSYTNGFVENKAEANKIITITKQSQVIALDTSLALLAANKASQYQLSVADALIYATAQFKGAELLTSDNHFSNLPGVCYFSKEAK